MIGRVTLLVLGAMIGNGIALDVVHGQSAKVRSAAEPRTKNSVAADNPAPRKNSSFAVIVVDQSGPPVTKDDSVAARSKEVESGSRTKSRVNDAKQQPSQSEIISALATELAGGDGEIVRSSAVHPASMQVEPLPEVHQPVVVLDPGMIPGHYGRQSCLESLGCGQAIGCDLWVRPEYMLFWTKAADVPPMVSTGTLGQNGTDVLFGGRTVDVPAHDGGRITAGLWANEQHCLGLQFSYFSMASTDRTFHADNGTNATLANPFINAQTNIEDTAIIASPNVQNGSVDIQLSNRFQMADALLRWNIEHTKSDRLDGVIGYLYTGMDEQLSHISSTTFLDPLGLQQVGTNILSRDDFRVRNVFQGVELGLASNSMFGAWSMELSGRVGLGSNHETLRIQGSTVTSVPQAAAIAAAGGVFALPTNIGDTSKNVFSCIPQVGLRLSRRLTARLDVSVGYNFIYWSQLARPSNQIDRTLNATQFPPGPLVGQASPARKFEQTDFWAQGVSFGCQWRF
ncbi:MAG: BBP7 family outer membrane beta-barrel protein [Pirellulales bacterium]